VAPEAFRRLGAEVAVICNDLAGQKINYQCGSEHTREHPQQLIETMQQHAAEYGFAFDGDGDRVVVVDSAGQVFDGHDLLFALAKHFQSQGLLRGETVVTIHQANRGLEDALHDIGVQTLYTPNGDRYLEHEMWGNDYLLGGEPGGNIIINDGHHTAADAIYTALVLGGVIVCNRDKSLREMTDSLKKRPQVTISFGLPTMLTLEQMSALQEQIRRREAELGADSRILIWDSHTESGVYRVMVEGCRENTEEQVTKAANIVRQLAQQAAGLGN
jgi:phosphoglucosamine mutase